MSNKEIIEIFETYKNNSNILNNNSFFEKFVNALYQILSLGDDIENNEEIANYFLENASMFCQIFNMPNIMKDLIDNNTIFAFVLHIILEFSPSDFDRFLENYKEQTLNYVKSDKFDLSINKKIFDFVAKYAPNLLYKMNFEEVFPELTEEILEKYGDSIIKYIQIKIHDVWGLISWRNSKILFDYLYKNQKDLLTALDLGQIFPEITDEILNQYGDIILMYSRKKTIPYNWYNNEAFCKLIIKYAPNLVNNGNLVKFFPELTEDVLEKNKDLILNIFISEVSIPFKWECNKILFDFVAKYAPNLLYKMNFEKVFPELTEEIFNQYRESLIKYIEDKGGPSSRWGSSQILFDYLNKNRRDLLYKMDLEKFFPEMTEEILNEYGNVIENYIKKNIRLLREKWRSSQILFDYLSQKRKDLLYKMILEELFPELTEEIFNKYRESLIRYIEDKEDNILPNWQTNKILLRELIRINSKGLNKIELEKFIFEDEYLEFFSESLEIDKNVFEQKLRELHSKNDELFRTLNFKILKIDGLNMNLLHKFTLYPDIQEKIIRLDSNTLQYFIKIANMLNKKEYDLTITIEKILNNIEKYSDLLSRLPIAELDDEKIKNLVYVLERSENIFNIRSAEDLSNESFKIKKDKYFENVAENIDNMNILEIRKAIFEKKYGIDYETAEFIYKRYYHDPEELREAGLDSRIIEIIEVFHDIMLKTSVESLKKVYQDAEVVETDFYTSISLESTIRSKYADMYKKTLYHVNENDRSKRPNLQNVFCKGKHIQFYEVDGNFNMQTHTLGAYGRWVEPEDYKKKWNMPSFFVHGICTTYIGNNQIAPARPRSPILGFIDYEDSALLLSGNYDLGSMNREFSITTEKPAKFLPPKTMIDRTRHTHNEMVIDRMIQGNDSTITKRNPSYIVYVVDDINNPDAFDASKNELYRMSLNAAADFDVPIVIVDRLKFAKRERKKCDELEKIFYETHEPKILKELFLTYMNNSVGCRQYDNVPHAEYHDIFSETVINSFLDKLILYFKNECNNLENTNLSNNYIMKLGYNIVTLVKLLSFEEEKKNYYSEARGIYEFYKEKVENLGMNLELEGTIKK